MDLNDAHKQIIGVLRDPEFLFRLVQVLEKERQIVQAEQRRNQQHWNLDDLEALSLLDLDAKIIGRERGLFTHFEDYAIAKLPQPAIISAGDLQEVAMAQLCGMTENTKDLQLQRFIHYVLLRVNDRETCRKAIDFGDWTRAGFETEEEDHDGDLWGDQEESFVPLENGYMVDVEIEKKGSHQVRAKGFIQGIASASAAQRLTDQIGPIVESVVRSLKLAATNAELESAKKHVEGFTIDPDVSEHSSDIPLAIGYLLERSEPVGDLLDEAMAYVFIDSPFARRIRNALELTYHADSTTNKAIALSLCVSSLEALLCSGRGRKTDQLWKRTSALLQADQALAEASASAIRILYDVRSRYLHGQAVSIQQADMLAVRRLVAAVLRGVLEWAVCKDNESGNTDDLEYTKELEATTTNAEHITHMAVVTKELAMHLREFTNVFGKDRVGELFNEVDDE